MDHDMYIEPLMPGRNRWVGAVAVMLVIALAGFIGIIGYFGIGPLVARPENPARPADVSRSQDQDVNSIIHPSPTPTPVPLQLSKEQFQSILTALARSVKVPDEVPDISLIRDPKQLAASDFFAKAQSGDLLIVFSKARVAYIIRPPSGQVVAQGTVGSE